MLFNSIEYIVFFFFVVGTFYALPHKFRWLLLLIASYYFYMAWNANLIILILISTLTDYFCALGIDNGRFKKVLLIFSLFVNLGLLWVFKYLDFSIQNLNVIFHPLIHYELPIVELILPMGISFYTFQTLAYTIDVYKGKAKREKHFGYFALYVTFFPQLVAGPIERAGNLIHQLKQKVKFKIENFEQGITQIIWGLFKKVVVADRLALFVDPVYNNVESSNGLVLLIATIFFAFQIYCDFSGYTDIAIGSAKILGIDLMKNFNTPYFATSLTDFWKRWHISLSTWFRDYVYIPLGGNRTLKWKSYYNLLITFLVSGFWHGANWTFIIWGAIHGICVAGERLIKEFTSLSVPRSIGWLLTFSITLMAWVFFRANHVSEAWIIISKISSFEIGGIYESIKDVGINKFDFILSPVFILLLLIIELYSHKKKEFFVFSKRSDFVKYPVLLGLVFLILIFGIEESNQFIYFQF